MPTAPLDLRLAALRRFAFTLTRNEDRANDLVQDCVEAPVSAAGFSEPPLDYVLDPTLSAGEPSHQR